MRQLLILAVLVLVGAFAYKQHFMRPPAPTKEAIQAAMPPPPAISKPPAPVLSPEEVQRIVDSTVDSNPGVRWEAAKLLIQMNAPEADEILQKMLVQDPDASLRKNIVSLFGDKPGPKASAKVAKALQDQDPEVRIVALQVLTKLGDYSVAPAISELLRDTEDRVRLQALQTLNALQVKRNEDIRRQQEEAERQRQEALKRQQEAAGKK